MFCVKGIHTLIIFSNVTNVTINMWVFWVGGFELRTM
jgi:hypothetical protein